MVDPPPGTRAPLGPLPRGVITALIMTGVMLPALIIRELVEAGTGPGPLADFGSIGVPVAMTAWLAPLVSYRRRDALLWLVGVGAYIFVVIAWRLAFLPYRDWAPRPDEETRLRRLSGPAHAGLWYLSDEAKPPVPGRVGSPQG